MAKRILFVSELGAGAGHLAPLVSVAERLRAAEPENQIQFAVINPSYAFAMFGDRGFKFLPIPERPDKSVKSNSLTGSFYELLAFLNYHREDQNAASLSAWDALLEVCKPDVIVADYSPSLCLAARGRYPVAILGNGYTLPPSHIDSYPALLPDVAAPRAQSMMCETLNSVLQKRGQPELRNLPAIFNVQYRALFSIPEMDPYGSLRRDRFLGSYDGYIAPTQPPENGSIFLYCSLAPEQINKIVEAGIATGRAVEAYIGPFDGPDRHFLRGFGVKVHDRLPDLKSALGRAAVLVTTAGAGLTLAGMMAGRPQLCLPSHIESSFNARQVVEQNSGESLDLGKDLEKLDETLRNVIEVQSYTRNAQALAQKINQYDLPEDPIYDVSKSVLALA